jgi:hypothetical protein
MFKRSTFGLNGLNGTILDEFKRCLAYLLGRFDKVKLWWAKLHWPVTVRVPSWLHLLCPSLLFLGSRRPTTTALARRLPAPPRHPWCRPVLVDTALISARPPHCHAATPCNTPSNPWTGDTYSWQLSRIIYCPHRPTRVFYAHFVLTHAHPRKLPGRSPIPNCCTLLVWILSR